MVEVIPFLDGIVNLLKLSNVLSKRAKREPIENDLSVEFLDQSLSTKEGRDSIVNVSDFYENEFIDGVKGFNPSALETYLHDYETSLEVSETYYTFNCSYYRTYYDSDQIREHARICTAVTTVTDGHHQVPEHLEKLCDSYKILANCYNIFKEKPKVSKGRRKIVEKPKRVQCFYTCNDPTAYLEAENIDVDALIRDDVSEKSVERRKSKSSEGGNYEIMEHDLLAADLSDKLKHLQQLKPKKKNKAARERERKEREAERKRSEDDRRSTEIVSGFMKSLQSTMEQFDTLARRLEPSLNLPEGGVLMRDPAIADVKQGQEYEESLRKVVERKKALLKKTNENAEIAKIKETQEESLELTNLPTSPVPPMFSFVVPVQWYSARPAPGCLDEQRRLKQIPANLTFGIVDWFEKLSIFRLADQAILFSNLMHEFPQWHHLAHGFTEEVLANAQPEEQNDIVNKIQKNRLNIMELFQQVVADSKRNDPNSEEWVEDVECDVIEKSLPGEDSPVPEADAIDSDHKTRTVVSHEPLRICLELISERCIITSINSIEVDEPRPTVVEPDIDFDQLRRRLSIRGSKKDAKPRKRKYEDLEDRSASGVTRRDIVLESGSLSKLETLDVFHPVLNELLNHFASLTTATNDRFARMFYNQRLVTVQFLPGHLYVDDHHQGGTLITINVGDIRNRVISACRRALIENVELNRPESYHSKAVLLRGERALVSYVDWSVELRNRTNVPSIVQDVVTESTTVAFHPMMIKLLACFRRASKIRRTGRQGSVVNPRGDRALIENVEMNRPEPYHSKAVLLRGDRALVEYIDWSVELRKRANISRPVIIMNEPKAVVLHLVMIKLLACFRRASRIRITGRQRSVVNPRGDRALNENVETNRPEPYHSNAVLLRGDRALVNYVDWSVELRNRTNVPSIVQELVTESTAVAFHPVMIKLLACFRRASRIRRTGRQGSVVNPRGDRALNENVEMNRPEPYHSKAVLLRGDRALVNYVDWSVELRNRTNVPSIVQDVVTESTTVAFQPMMIKLLACFRRASRIGRTGRQGSVVNPRGDRALNENVGMNRPEPYHPKAILLRGDRALVEYIDWLVELRNRTNVPSIVQDVATESTTVAFHPMMIKLLDCFRRASKIRRTGRQQSVVNPREDRALIENVEMNRPEPYHSKAILLRGDRALVEYIDWSVEFCYRTNVPIIELDVVTESTTVAFHPVMIKLLGCFRRASRIRRTGRQRSVVNPREDRALIENVGMNRPEPYHPKAILLRGDRALVEYIDWSVEFRYRTNVPIIELDVVTESTTVAVHPMMIKLLACFRRASRIGRTGRQGSVVYPRGDRALNENVGMNRPEPYHPKAILLRGDRALVEYIDWSVELRNRTNVPSIVQELVTESTAVAFHPVMIKLLACFCRASRIRRTGRQRNVVNPRGDCALIENVEINRPDPYHSEAILLRGDRALVEYVDWSVEFCNGTNVPGVVIDVTESVIIELHPVIIKLLDCFCRFTIRTTVRQRHFVEPRRDQALVEYTSISFTDLVELDRDEQRTGVSEIGLDWKYEDLPDWVRNNFTKSELLKLVEFARWFESKHCVENNRPEPYHSKAVLLRGDRALVEYKDWSVELRSRTNVRRIVVDPVVLNEPSDRFALTINDRFKELYQSQRSVVVQPWLGQIYVEDYHQGGTVISINVRNIQSIVISSRLRANDRVLAEYRPLIEVDRVNESRTVLLQPVMNQLLERFRRFARIRIIVDSREERALIENGQMNRPRHSKAVLLRGDRALVEYVDWSVEFHSRTIVTSAMPDVNESRFLVFHPVLKELLVCFRRFVRNTGRQRNVANPRGDRALVEICNISKIMMVYRLLHYLFLVVNASPLPRTTRRRNSDLEEIDEISSIRVEQTIHTLPINNGRAIDASRSSVRNMPQMNGVNRHQTPPETQPPWSTEFKRYLAMLQDCICGLWNSDEEIVGILKRCATILILRWFFLDKAAYLLDLLCIDVVVLIVLFIYLCVQFVIHY